MPVSILETAWSHPVPETDNNLVLRKDFKEIVKLCKERVLLTG
jgi:hypothetical protein